MNTPTAFATVTSTLQRLLSDVTEDVTIMPPSTARSGRNGDQLNIFLYGVYCDPALTNSSMPGLRLSHENANPPLSLVLKYLITTYGEDDDDISGQRLMEHAMRILHSHPVLDKSAIEDDTRDSNSQNQIERIRITPDMLAPDDICRLWTTFRPAQYRLSIGYEISAVLIDSVRSDSASPAISNRGANTHHRHASDRPSPSSPESSASDREPAFEPRGPTAVLEQLVQKIDPKANWTDLVLPAEQVDLLKEIRDRAACRDQVYEDWGFEETATRGLGISVLFSGENGSGKTMAAEVIANDLELDLYRIDLAAVVSKYIGETEKNLGKLFNAA